VGLLFPVFIKVGADFPKGGRFTYLKLLLDKGLFAVYLPFVPVSGSTFQKTGGGC